MIKTVEAVVDDEGKVRLLQPVHLESSRRALVVILDEPGVSVTKRRYSARRRSQTGTGQRRMRHGLTCSRQSNPRSVPVLRFITIQAPSSGGLSRRRPRRLGTVPSHKHAYGDASAISLTDESFSQGSLRIQFCSTRKTVHGKLGLMLSEVGILKPNVARRSSRQSSRYCRVASSKETSDRYNGLTGGSALAQ